MTSTRRSIRQLLDRAANDTPIGPDETFVDALEQRLLSGAPTLDRLAPVVPLRRRARPVVAGVAAASIILGGTVAAAAGPWRHADERVRSVTPATEPSSATSIDDTTVAAVTTVVTARPTATTTGATSIARQPTPDPTNEATTSVATDAPPAISIEPSSTAATTTTVKPKPATTTTTAPHDTTTTVSPSATTSTTTPATTTEVTVPASLSLSCAVTAANTVRCSWSRSTDASVVGYRLLRGQPSGGQGRVFSTGAGDAAYTDATAASATDYSYVVHAVRADGTSVAHSGLVTIHCCEAPTTTTSTTRV